MHLTEEELTALIEAGKPMPDLEPGDTFTISGVYLIERERSNWRKCFKGGGE